MTLPPFFSDVRILGLAGLALLVASMSGCLEPVPPAPQDPWTNPFLVPGSTVLVQIDHAPGRAPSALALEGLSQVMQHVGARPSFTIQQTIEPTDGNYSSEDILRLHRNLYSGSPTTWSLDDQTVLHLLYLDGSTPPRQAGQVVRGVAFLRTGFPVMAIFADDLSTTSLYRASVSLPGQSNATFERSILIHEYGHMLGLVGCGTPQVHPHADPASECHSAHHESVMYPNLHTSEDPFTWALDDEMQPVWRFDQDDWADIRAYQRSLPTQGQS